jgi:4-hydroxybenzoate polyprenyltransferase
MAAPRETGSLARAWAELLRVPNLPTVPGEAVAGAALAAGPTAAFAPAAAWAAVSATALYAGGLLLNDWADAQIDAAERPARPIPSGRVTRRAVLAAAAVALTAGVACAVAAGPLPALLSAVLAAAIVLYDLLLKRGAAAGPAVLGLCRAGALLMGAAAVPGGLAVPAVAAAAGAEAAYVAALSVIAAGEMRAAAAGAAQFLPALAAAAGAIAVGAAAGWRPFLFAPLAVIAVWHAAECGVRLRGAPPARRAAAVGALIRGTLLLQAAWCAAAGHLAPAVALLFLYPVSLLLGRRFSGS